MQACLPEFYRWFEYACAAFSMGGNSLLLFFILYSTPQELKLYSRVLLSSCISDMLFTTVGFFSEMHISLRHGYCTYTINGFFKDAPLIVVYLQVLAWLCFMYVAIFTLVVPFVYRSFIMNSRQFGAFVAFEVALAFAATAFFGMACWPYTQEAMSRYTEIHANDTCRDVGEIPFYRLTDAVGSIVGLSLLNYMLLVIVHYVLIITCSYKIWRHIRRTNMSQNLAKLCSQLNIVLGFQATTPFVVCVIPVVYAISAVLLSASSSLAMSTMEVATMLLSLIPVFNPIYTIFFVKAYRHALLRCLGLVLPIKRPSDVHPSRTSAGFDLSVAPSIF